MIYSHPLVIYWSDQRVSPELEKKLDKQEVNSGNVSLTEEEGEWNSRGMKDVCPLIK